MEKNASDFLLPPLPADDIDSDFQTMLEAGEQTSSVNRIAMEIMSIGLDRCDALSKSLESVLVDRVKTATQLLTRQFSNILLSCMYMQAVRMDLEERSDTSAKIRKITRKALEEAAENDRKFRALFDRLPTTFPTKGNASLN